MKPPSRMLAGWLLLVHDHQSSAGGRPVATADRHARLWAGAACRMNASATTPTCVSRWASAVAVMARALRSARRFRIVNDLNLHGHVDCTFLNCICGQTVLNIFECSIYVSVETLASPR